MKKREKLRIAVDTGGTFTDCVYRQNAELRVVKVFSTPRNPAEAVLSALREVGIETGIEMRHGTTVATNTLLERTGARVAFVTTAGFEDTLGIGRQARMHLYDWFAPPNPPLAPAGMRFGIAERTGADGTILKRVSAADLERLVRTVRNCGAESISVSLIFSFANSENERAVAEVLRQLDIPVSISHEILPEFREYERASTVTVNAYLAPKIGRYLRDLERSVFSGAKGARLSVMQSSGGIVDVAIASQNPVRTLLSGPAGGVIGASRAAGLSGFDRIISFDMGGTSTDVCLVDGEPKTTSESMVAGFPISVPMLDIHTVGAGGGSLARFDSAGVLHVGPQSAGAEPGPICYGRGTEPTVTDANVILGRMDPEFFLDGRVPLDQQRTRKYMLRAKGKLSTVEEFAEGIIRLAEAAMEKAIRVISVERGYDPRDFTLVSFGGAAGMHACALARALRIPRVLVPRFPGALSALGILMSDVIKDFSRTVMLTPGSPLIERFFFELERSGRSEMNRESRRSITQRSLDMRYVGQGYELRIPAGPRLVQRFHQAHLERYGYADMKRAVEVVNLHVRMIGRTKKIPLSQRRARPGDGRQAIVRRRAILFGLRRVQAPILDRSLLRPGDVITGPAIVAEYSATFVLFSGCRARVDEWGNLLVEVDHARR